MEGTVGVRRVRIASAEPVVSPRGTAARLEDALRCASLPAPWRHRVVLVRRLRLRANARASSQQWSRQIEQQWQAIAAILVPGDSATATAEAVWFDDEPGARLALIARIAGGADTTAWFWQRLLPRPHTEMQASRVVRIAALLTAPWRYATPAPAEQRRFVRDALDALDDRGLAEQVLTLLAVSAPALIPVEHALVGRRPRQSFGAASRMVRQALEPLVMSVAAGIQHSPAVTPLQGILTAADSCTGPQGDNTRRDAQTAVASGLALRPPQALRGMSAQAQGALAGERPSDWAGAFFLLNLWTRLADAPRTAADAVRWLRAIANSLHIPPDDALHGALVALDDTQAEPAAQPPPLRALRRACVQAVRLPLRRICRRRGQIAVTRTHLSVTLPVRASNLRIRRFGLDLDPGWSPTLERVVEFHYE